MVRTQSNSRSGNYRVNKNWEESSPARKQVTDLLQELLGEEFKTAPQEEDFRGNDLIGTSGTKVSLRLRRPINQDKLQDLTLRPAEVKRFETNSIDLFAYGYTDKLGNLTQLYLLHMPSFCAGAKEKRWTYQTKTLPEMDKHGNFHSFDAYPWDQLLLAGIAFPVLGPLS